MEPPNLYPVKLYVYDLSKGLARRLSPMMLGEGPAAGPGEACAREGRAGQGRGGAPGVFTSGFGEKEGQSPSEPGRLVERACPGGRVLRARRAGSEGSSTRPCRQTGVRSGPPQPRSATLGSACRRGGSCPGGRTAAPGEDRTARFGKD